MSARVHWSYLICRVERQFPDPFFSGAPLQNLALAGILVLSGIAFHRQAQDGRVLSREVSCAFLSPQTSMDPSCSKNGAMIQWDRSMLWSVGGARHQMPTILEVTVTRSQLLKRLDNAWQALKESYAGLSDAELVEPGVTGVWSVKDTIAHVTW
jgi:hypothetical protein